MTEHRSHDRTHAGVMTEHRSHDRNEITDKQRKHSRTEGTQQKRGSLVPRPLPDRVNRK